MPVLAKLTSGLRRVYCQYLSRTENPARLIERKYRVIERKYRGHDIYKLESRYFGVPTDCGPLDIERFKRTGLLAQCLIGQSVEEARGLIDALADESGAKPHRYVLLGDDPDAAAHFVRYSKTSPDNITAVDPDNISGRIPELKERGFSGAIIPWSGSQAWQDNSLEVASSQIAPMVYTVFPDGACMRFIGEGVHRLLYNKAYLASLFSKLAIPTGLRVLEVGCSDGMVCNIMVGLGASEVIGVDAMETVGCCYQHERIAYQACDTHALPFADRSFDLVVSIATFEHLYDPPKAMAEIIRVLRPGGHAYVQAGPLYHSPFGHHMFGYFDECPWIHLRMTPEQIGQYADKTGVALRIGHESGTSVENYVRGALAREEINGLKLPEYRLDELSNRSDLSILMRNTSYEGVELLNDQIRAELPQYDDATLTEHGFEILFRKVAP